MITHYTIRREQGYRMGDHFDYWEQTFLTDMTDAQAVSAVDDGDITRGDIERLDPELQTLDGLADDGTITLFRAADDAQIYSDAEPSQ